ncbi:nicotinate-nucleotide adenylyltransferase [Bacillaceae bacterium]
MKIGILGGTFDPVHIAHLIVAEQARSRLFLDEVWFMPARIPPHKQEQRIAASLDRLNMLKLAVADNPHFKVTDIELRRNGPSYTVDTMKILKRQYPEYAFFFLIGGDMVEYLPRFERIEELRRLVTFVGLARPGYPKEAPAGYPVLEVPVPQIDISSSLIREMVRRGDSIRYLVPEKVEHYIKEKRLYA